MPTKHSGDHICEKCGVSFEWKHFEMIRQNIDSPDLIIETIPKGAIVHIFEQDGEGVYNIAVNCPQCYQDNHFAFKESIGISKRDKSTDK